uniref:ATP synthase F0 subunit 8 n=1 Tax=Sicista betulina TaxID=489448 RepID=UPI0022A6D8D2|nr:ATP synthase F0 subunit 8 [Sicista betulina]UPU97289.1 ATP synthase F0 subunit 8 [Sicista betulina]UPU97367.1 ATP synthase F0 subunit 8 [Sicista betulina]UPU97393.1 ATP synthase F0 subunit 8 [Sicista betulina]UPU97406.1 ATP synthase F0 subunit 8 [Sicista betulina]UPU97419.1 ATP synthase F0 subunit 8 [Sicista betulina]
MPQLDTSTWFTTIMSSTMGLFILFQLKLATFKFYPNPNPKSFSSSVTPNPWESKWTKIYSPLSLPLH